MVINVQRIKRKVSNKNTGFNPPLREWIIRLFSNSGRKKASFRKSLRPALIMY